MANKTNPTRIQLKGSGRLEEYTAGGAITPGHLIELASTGKVIVHSTSGGPSGRLIALEDSLQGKTIDDAYASGDRVRCAVASPGDEAYIFLAAGENAAIGDKLVSNGDGTLQVRASTELTVAVALEALDLSDSSNEEDTRIRVRFV